MEAEREQEAPKVRGGGVGSSPALSAQRQKVTIFIVQTTIKRLVFIVVNDEDTIGMLSAKIYVNNVIMKRLKAFQWSVKAATTIIEITNFC